MRLPPPPHPTLCAPAERKITFLYLANDVIQQSRKKGPLFIDEFGVAFCSPCAALALSTPSRPPRCSVASVGRKFGAAVRLACEYARANARARAHTHTHVPLAAKVLPATFGNMQTIAITKAKTEASRLVQIWR